MKNYRKIIKIIQEDMNLLHPFKRLNINVKLFEAPLNDIDAANSKMQLIFSRGQILKYTIHACTNTIEAMGTMFENQFKRRYREFMESLNVPINEYSFFVFIVLHEYGHIEMNTFPEDFNCDRECKMIIESNDALSHHAFEESDIRWYLEYEDLNIVYKLNITELNCDIFAMKHFYSIWRKVINNITEAVGPYTQ